MEAKSKNLWDRFWRDQQGRVVIFQRPNIWIIIWATMAVGHRLLPAGVANNAARVAGTAALLIWAVLEISRGATYLRRLLGLAVLLVTLTAVFKIGL